MKGHWDEENEDKTMKEIKIRIADSITISIYIDLWQEDAMEKLKKDLQNLTWKLFHRVEIVSM